MNLCESRIGKVGSLAIALYSHRAVRCHGIGREEIYIAITAGSYNNGMGRVALQLTGNKITHDNTAGTTIDDYKVEHFITGFQHNVALLYLTAQRRVCAQQKLLARLTFGIESTRYLRTAE